MDECLKGYVDKCNSIVCWHGCYVFRCSSCLVHDLLEGGISWIDGLKANMVASVE